MIMRYILSMKVSKLIQLFYFLGSKIKTKQKIPVLEGSAIVQECLTTTTTLPSMTGIKFF